ncbi:MAG: CBS domain-containing protein [Pseudonocardiales bacterium]|nr:CBS domain-containing protein [Pseudonocardiales bacterium]
MRVSDIMTRSVVTTTPRAPVKDAAVVLAGHGVTLLPVVEEGDRLVGVLTEADVVRGRIPPDPRRGAWHGSQAGPPPPATVGDVMSSPPLTAHPHTDAAELATMMIDRRLRSVPVVNQDRLVGIITRRDLVRIIARDDALIAADVRRRLECYGGPDRWAVHARNGAVTITDQYANPTDHHVALVLAQAVPGVVHAKIMHFTSQPA